MRGGTFGFVDDIYFTGEESGKPFLPHGGTEWVLDVKRGELWAAPVLGRGAWENVCPLETGDRNTIALLMGDDSQSAPLYLYVGQKNALGGCNFLDRNGLAVGQLYVWVASNGDLSPEDFNGFGASRVGSFQPIDAKDDLMAGMPGHDAEGFRDGDTLRSEADAMGAFSFSPPGGPPREPGESHPDRLRVDRPRLGLPVGQLGNRLPARRRRRARRHLRDQPAL